MKKYQSILLVLFILGVSKVAFAQQTSLNTLYNQNNYLINPANAGLENCHSAYFNHRNQWTGITDSPVRNVLTFDSHVFKKHGLGVNLGMYEAGLLRNLNLHVSYAYHVQLSVKSKLSFGVSAGLIQQSFQFEDAIVTDYADKTIAGGNFSDVGFTSNAGILLTTNRLRLGVSLPQFISSGLFVENAVHKENYRLLLHSTFHGAYDIVNNNHWTVTPSLLYRNAAFNGNQIDIGLKGMWKSTLGFGAMYRSAYGMIGILELNLFEKLSLSYGYGFGSGNLTALSSGSHEVMLGLKFCKDPSSIKKNKMDEPIEMEVTEETQDKKTEEEIVMIKEVEDKERVPSTEIVTTAETVTENVEIKVEETKTAEAKENIVSEVIEASPVPISVEKGVPAQTINLDSLNEAFSMGDRILLYDLNSTDNVTSKNEEKVSQMVTSILKNHPDLNVKIVGHTCDLGDNDLNTIIGKGRAERAKNQLIKKGINSDRIATYSEGQNNPRLRNDSEQNRVNNRRAQFVFAIRKQ